MWIILALISALAMAIRLAVAKDLTKNFGGIFQTMLMAITALIFVIPYVVINFDEIPFSNPKFLILTIIIVFTFITANSLVINASKLSPLSIVTPLLSLSPIFPILVEDLVAGTLPTKYGTIGIILVVIGGYVLNASACKKGCLEPIKKIFIERGSLLAIIAAIFFAIGGTLQKYAIEESSISAFLLIWLVIVTILTLILSPLIEGDFKKNIRTLLKKKNSIKLASTGLFFAIAVTLYSIAVTFTNAAYVLALKRTVALFGVLIGWLIFKEVKITERMIGAIIMVAGVTLIAVLG